MLVPGTRGKGWHKQTETLTWFADLVSKVGESKQAFHSCKSFFSDVFHLGADEPE
jgi:hypothetical protein